MIKIKKSPTADTRTCDWATVSIQQLEDSSVSHISDVGDAMDMFCAMIRQAADDHDHDKLTEIEHFHADFQTGFKKTAWWDNHRKINRHHINMADGVRDDVNLIDVLEHIADCVMAGAARKGSVDGVYGVELPAELLQKAVYNTVELLKANVEVTNE